MNADLLSNDRCGHARTLPERVEQVFAVIARERMAGLPICHPQLRVQAVGFERAPGPAEGEQGWFGVLVTPWAMNLVWFPDAGAPCAAPGNARVHVLAEADYEFIGAHDPQLGRYEVCSLFSPMQDFADQNAAIAVACGVLDQLRAPPAPPVTVSRRSLFSGRFGEGAR